MSDRHDCIWVWDEDHCKHDTKCGHAFQTIDGTVSDNGFKFCPFCGGPITLEKQASEIKEGRTTPRPNERIIGGHLQFRRFAYLDKNDPCIFGLLEAVDAADARAHLGPDCHIQPAWLTLDESYEQSIDVDRRWEIVSSIFNGGADHV